jgi:integrase
MAQKFRKFTDINIRNLKPGNKRQEVRDPEAKGLYVVVQPSGVKSFAVRYRYAGRLQKLTLGDVRIGLAAARLESSKIAYELVQGRDPAAAKRRQKEAQRRAVETEQDTFRAVTEAYMKMEGHKLRSAAWRQGVLDRLIYPTIGARPIAEIRKSEIVGLLDKIHQGKPLGVKGGAVMADNSLAIIRKIMNWHAARSDGFRSPIVRGMARVRPEQRTRERILDDDEIRVVWQAAEATADPFARFVQFLLLTAARRMEAARMQWSELSGSDWTLPAARNKVGKELIRPLSAAALDILAKVPRFVDCPFVFSYSGKTALNEFSWGKSRFDEQAGVGGWRLHDLRRTARSLMSRAGVNADHAEQCLGHIIGGVRGRYDRHSYYIEKKRAFEALAAQIERILHPHDNVTALPARGGHAP